MPTERMGVGQRPDTERERIAAAIADRMDGPVTVLGIVFFLLVLAESMSIPNPAVRTAFAIAGWAIWLVFVVEFAARVVIAPSTWGYLRRNWWQVVFLAVPFLRFTRVLARARVWRVGRVASSFVRSTRTATRKLTGRLGWLVAVTAIVVLSVSHVLYQFDVYDSYAEALHRAALAAINGEPLGSQAALAQVLDIVLGVYAVAVFATLAAAMGAFFLDRPRGAEGLSADDGGGPVSGRSGGGPG